MSSVRIGDRAGGGLLLPPTVREDATPFVDGERRWRQTAESHRSRRLACRTEGRPALSIVRASASSPPPSPPFCDDSIVVPHLKINDLQTGEHCKVGRWLASLRRVLRQRSCHRPPRLA